MKKLLKLLAIAGLAMGAVGCASVGGIANKYVNNDKEEGVMYGVGLDARDINEICDAIKNKDVRCLDKSKYQTVAVAAKVGYADGFVGMTAFADINLDIGAPCRTGSDKCTYLKVEVNKNQLGTVLEVASRPNEGKCHWSGMPRIGGTVCPAYGYDYRKDFKGIPR